MNFRVAFMCLLVVVLPVASGEATTIDLFDSSQSITANPVATAAGDWTPGGDMVGGERDLVVLWDSGFGDVRLSTNPYASSVLSHAQDGGVTGRSEVQWDGPDGDPSTIDPTGLGGVDLTDGGVQQGIGIEVEFADNPIALTMTVWTDGSNRSEATVVLPGGVLAPTTEYLDFAGDFVPVSGAGADFTNVGAIELEIDGTLRAGADLRIGGIESTVPEPSTMVLCILGLACLLGWTWRRK